MYWFFILITSEFWIGLCLVSDSNFWRVNILADFSVALEWLHILRTAAKVGFFFSKEAYSYKQIFQVLL